MDMELRKLITNKKFVENLSHEKPTKRFFDIAHNVGKGDSLAGIKNSQWRGLQFRI
jgi:hypothetical protein